VGDGVPHFFDGIHALLEPGEKTRIIFVFDRLAKSKGGWASGERLRVAPNAEVVKRQ
jgi:hypothetical protein